jgi:hypothetical protein
VHNSTVIGHDAERWLGHSCSAGAVRHHRTIVIRRGVLHLRFADGVTRDMEVLVCRVATASAVPEAKGALAVDGGDVECSAASTTRTQQRQRSDQR